jgi:hypothetical protein
MIAHIAPAPLLDDLPRPWLFLAGAIDQDRAERWQDAAVTALRDQPGTVLNPRRDAWDATWVQDLANPQFAAQVAWELDGLERADVIICWLPASAQAPISLLEIGLHARGRRLLIGCEPGFHRAGNVHAVAQRFAVPVVETLSDLLTLARNGISTTSRGRLDDHGADPTMTTEGTNP